MSKVYQVRITNGGEATPYSPEFQTEEKYLPGWKSALKKAYSQGEAFCCCPGLGTKQLSIRHYDESDSFGLARFPNSGEDHTNDCRFYAPNPQKSGMGAYLKGVVDERGDGTLKVRLALGINRQEPAAPASDVGAGQRPAGSKGRQPAMKLLGLLHLLWNEAGLNVWWPAMEGKRDSGLVHWLVDSVARNIATSHHKLHEVLLLGARSDKGGAAHRNRDRVTFALNRNTRLLVITPLAAHNQEREEKMARSLPIADFHGIPLLTMTEAHWANLQRQFAFALSAWRAGARVVTIAQVELRRSPKGIVADIVGISLMQVTANWIPVDSFYERRIAEKLTEERRGFMKPLRFDAGADVVFPDFLLLDTRPAAPMEVFGLSDEDYQARKLEKCAYYREQFGVDGWWCWDAAADPDGKAIPPFPLPDRKSNS